MFDELQNLKEVYLNGDRKLVDRLFNFFVAITKVNHLSHVLVMMLDAFFIEEIHLSSALKNTSEYYLVDYFNDDTAMRILLDEGLSEEDARYVVENIGGVPWMMERILSSRDVKAKVRELYEIHMGRLREFLLRCRDYERAEAVLKELLEGKDVLRRENISIIEALVQSEILFYDPLKGTVAFQTRLDERAAREIIS